MLIMNPKLKQSCFLLANISLVRYDVFLARFHVYDNLRAFWDTIVLTRCLVLPRLTNIDTDLEKWQYLEEAVPCSLGGWQVPSLMVFFKCLQFHPLAQALIRSPNQSCCLTLSSAGQRQCRYIWSQISYFRVPNFQRHPNITWFNQQTRCIAYRRYLKILYSHRKWGSESPKILREWWSWSRVSNQKMGIERRKTVSNSFIPMKCISRCINMYIIHIYIYVCIGTCQCK